ncbi:MAG: hypothetical protein RL291_551 [Pseudomonadota bacterium]
MRLPVLSAAIAAYALSGCAVGGANLSSGFVPRDEVAPKASSRVNAPVSTATVPPQPKTARSGETKVANLDPRASTGDSAKAPPGALADRNYSATKLDAERARDMINAYRKSKGLKPLQLNAQLTDAAKAHSQDLAKWDRISHFGSDGSNPWDRVKRTGYRAKLAAENVGTGQASLDEVFKGWQKSPTHDQNLLLADAEHMGIALIQDPKTEFKTFWTLVVGSSM